MRNIYILLALYTIAGFGQSDSTNMVLYTPEFKFKEGIFLSFDQVKHNNPIPKTRIISDTDYDDNSFFERVLSQKKVYYYNNIGNREDIKTENIWGYSRNGFLFIGVNNGYYRITMIGSICHFVSYYTYETPNYNYPYYYDSYYRDPYRYSPYATTSTTEMRQYLFDFETGRIYDYNVESLEIIFMKDPEIHDEYVALSNKKKKQMKFLYMRKFNERNPLYFPKNQK